MAELSRKGFAVGAIHYGQPGKTSNLYEIELPQSIIDSFARFLIPEIRLYASEEGRKELEAWKKKYFDKSEE